MPVRNREDRYGFDEGHNHLAAAVGRFVPQRLARRAVSVAVKTDKQRYEPGESVEITAEFVNRLPVPIALRTPRQRLWGWSVDADLEASDDPQYTRSIPGRFTFRPRERKHIEWHWDGRFHRTDEDRWVLADAGDHELRVFVALDDREPSATTTVSIG